MMSGIAIPRWVTFGFALWLISTATAIAANFSGTVEEVSADDNTVRVKLNGKKEESKTFKLSPTAVIMVDGKKGQLQDIVEGQTIMVVASANNLASKLVLKTPKDLVSKKSTSKKGMDDDEMASADDRKSFWPQFGGPNRDNISSEKGLLQRWPEEGPPVAWQQTGLGDGYSSVSIAKGKLYTMGSRGDDEVVIALDAETGKPIWVTETGGKTYRHNEQGHGPRGTPTVDDDRVYALGASGDLICLGAEKGERVWNKNILDTFDGRNIVWGISESVLIDGKNLICTPGGKDGTVVAIDKLTGRGVWKCNVDNNPQAAYSSAIVVDFEGERFYVNFVHSAVIAVRLKDGKLLWGNQESANDVANCSSALYSDGMIFTSSGYGRGAAMFKLSKGASFPKLGYATKEMANHHGGMVLVDGYVYGFNEQIMTCLDLKTGKPAWKDRSVGKGSLTCADGLLYLRGENGKVGLCAATPKGYEELGRFEPPKSERPAWSHPVVCGGKLYLRDLDTIVAYDIKKK